jgi:hypothetical protein
MILPDGRSHLRSGVRATGEAITQPTSTQPLNVCVSTLLLNRPGWNVVHGDVIDPSVWNPWAYDGVSLLAGGVPCSPFTIAGKQLDATDERDHFAWAVELTGIIRPRALLLENVRGLSLPRFAGYRQHILDRLLSLGYVAQWKLLFVSGGRTSGLPACGVVPFPREQPTAPNYERDRSDWENFSPALTWQEPRQCGQPRPADGPVAHPRELPAQHGVLVP